MKASAIVRIVIWSLVALILIGILLGGVIAPRVLSHFNLDRLASFGCSWVTGLNYASADRYTVGPGSLDAAAITAIEVNWVDGEVIFAQGAENAVSFSETSSQQLNEEWQLRYYLDGSTLRIQYCEGGISIRPTLNKVLTLTLPASLSLDDMNVNGVSSDIKIPDIMANRLDISTTSGNVELNRAVVPTIRINSVSGDIKAADVEADTLDVSTTSGDIRFDGSALKSISCNTVSGSIRLSPGETFTRLDANSTSGDITLDIPESVGFRAHHSSVSGDFSCNAPVQTQNKTAIYNGGGAEIEFSTVSGDMRVNVY